MQGGAGGLPGGLVVWRRDLIVHWCWHVSWWTCVLIHCRVRILVYMRYRCMCILIDMIYMVYMVYMVYMIVMIHSSSIGIGGPWGLWHSAILDVPQENLVIRTITQPIPKHPQSPLHRIRHRLLLGLLKGSPFAPLPLTRPIPNVVVKGAISQVHPHHARHAHGHLALWVDIAKVLRQLQDLGRPAVKAEHLVGEVEAAPAFQVGYGAGG